MLKSKALWYISFMVFYIIDEYNEGLIQFIFIVVGLCDNLILVIDPGGTFRVHIIVQLCSSLEMAFLTDYNLASALSFIEAIRNSLSNQGSPVYIFIVWVK